MRNKIVNKMFVAIGSNGKRYKIIESTEMIIDSSFGHEGRVPGMKWYSLDDGTKLNPIGNNKYEIIDTDIVISF
jgi:hypothetical protein